MRLYQKKQHLKALERLMEAQEDVCRSIEKGEAQEAAELLAWCQQEAVRVGTAVEETEGNGTGTVHSLEEYCDLVYQLYENVQREGAAGGEQQETADATQQVGRLSKPMQRCLKAAKSSLEQVIAEQKEVVFLPYKASMWDSLESVWRAAREEPDCDALVIPIPYYDRNPDGSLGEMHDERDLYPEDVPVMSYEAYDFASRHPDMIFIHNPYDDGNCVTSVHPFFYSKNLKQYTDDLVYIPYFVLQEIDPSDEAAIKEIEHFIVTAGVVNADHVIVQSEAMRQIYVDVMTGYTGEKMRLYWQKKISGLGSPKVDRVRSLREGDLRLPEEWEERIQKEDGSKKKIFFYNTSVSALLNYGEAMLEKIERNLRVFEENRADVTLLWRPHPLSEATLAAMCPELKERYDGIVQGYKAAGWGIYDDPPDLDRAIAISDAYYGDWSSVVWLYQQTGKPIMIQSVEV